MPRPWRGQEFCVMDMDMEFNVAQLMKELVGAKRVHDFGMPALRLSEALPGESQELTAHDVQGKIQLTRLGRQVRAVGKVQAQVELQCGRCLEPFVTTIEAPLDELFKQTIDVVSGAPVPTEPGESEDEAFPIDQNHILDLTEPVRQALLVSLPMRPLCKDDCRGLCPTCGTNWNVATCDCPTEEVDPRFAALSELLAGIDTDEPSKN
jgi:uncharacterized protein